MLEDARFFIVCQISLITLVVSNCQFSFEPISWVIDLSVYAMGFQIFVMNKVSDCLLLLIYNCFWLYQNARFAKHIIARNSLFLHMLFIISFHQKMNILIVTYNRFSAVVGGPFPIKIRSGIKLFYSNALNNTYIV